MIRAPETKERDRIRARSRAVIHGDELRTAGHKGFDEESLFQDYRWFVLSLPSVPPMQLLPD